MLRPCDWREFSTMIEGDVAEYRQYHIDTVPLLTADEVAAQIHRAKLAQRQWARTSFAQRQSFLRSLKAWVLRDMEGIVRVACRDTGKTSESGYGESRDRAHQDRGRCSLWRDPYHAQQNRLVRMIPCVEPVRG